MKDESATLLTIAARRGDTKICRILLKAGADVNARKLKDGCTALRVAAQHKTVGTIRFLLDAGADPELPHNDGSTPLFIAAQNGTGPLVDALLAGGASAATPMNDGATPLFISSQGGHAAVVKTLLETLRGRQSVDATLTKGIQRCVCVPACARVCVCAWASSLARTSSYSYLATLPVHRHAVSPSTSQQPATTRTWLPSSSRTEQM